MKSGKGEEDQSGLNPGEPTCFYGKNTPEKQLAIGVKVSPGPSDTHQWDP